MKTYNELMKMIPENLAEGYYDDLIHLMHLCNDQERNEDEIDVEIEKVKIQFKFLNIEHCENMMFNGKL